MKKNIYVMMALVAAMAWTGCMREQLAPEDPREQLTAAADSVWTVTLQAVKKDAPDTKGLAIEGEEANTTVLKSIWKTGEEVKVFLESACIGTLTATPDADAHKATLSGTVTTTALVAGTSTITLLTPRETWDYTGQAGTLLEAANSIEKMYHYTAATGVLVKAVDTENNTITTDNATFVNQQSIFRLSFRYKKPDETKAAIVAKSVTISSKRGKLVQSQSVDGTTVTKGPISVTLGTPSSATLFVALRNGDEADEAVTFTVIDTENATYKGSKFIPAGYKAGGFVSVKNATLDRLGVGKSETVISTAEGVM